MRHRATAPPTNELFCSRYGSKIDSTVDRQAPYRWTLGDGSTIEGLEIMIAGAPGIPPMLPGGVRRCIIPSKLAYESLAKPFKNNLQVQECGGGVGPVPPEERADSTSMGAGEFQRFKNIYCNANRPYQPDLVLDGESCCHRTSRPFRHHATNTPLRLPPRPTAPLLPTKPVKLFGKRT